jgi:histidine triad (HIT) family protein
MAAEVVTEDDQVIVLKDILPKAPVHLLVIPKTHIPSISDLTSEHESLMGHMIVMAQKMAEKHGINLSGYKLVFNVGKDGGQIIQHVHLHLLGGKQLGE